MRSGRNVDGAKTMVGQSQIYNYGSIFTAHSVLVAIWLKLFGSRRTVPSRETHCNSAEFFAILCDFVVRVRVKLPQLSLSPVLLYEDNVVCRVMVTSTQISGRNKYFELKQHFIRELYNDKVFKLMAVSTQKQIADIFTKALARPTFEIHRKSLLEGITLDLINGASTEGGS